MCALSLVNTETRPTTAKQGAAVPWLARGKIGARDPARECPLQGAWECQGGLMLGPFQGSGGLHYRLLGSDQGYRKSIVRVAGVSCTLLAPAPTSAPADLPRPQASRDPRQQLRRPDWCARSCSKVQISPSSSILKRLLRRINLTTNESACGVRDLAGILESEELASGSVRRSSLHPRPTSGDNELTLISCAGTANLKKAGPRWGGPEFPDYTAAALGAGHRNLWWPQYPSTD
jgi:hypothetical protein